jgi:hypothetical protein
MRPRLCHIALKYHHFWSHVENGNLLIRWIDTKHQLADIFTKPLAASSFIPCTNLCWVGNITIEGVLWVALRSLPFSVGVAHYQMRKISAEEMFLFGAPPFSRLSVSSLSFSF